MSWLCGDEMGQKTTVALSAHSVGDSGGVGWQGNFAAAVDVEGYGRATTGRERDRAGIEDRVVTHVFRFVKGTTIARNDKLVYRGITALVLEVPLQQHADYVEALAEEVQD